MSASRDIADRYVTRDGKVLDGNPALDHKAIDGDELDRLARLSTIEYERERMTAAELLGVRTGALDDMVKKLRRQTPSRRVSEQPKPDLAALKASASAIIDSHDVLDTFARAFRKLVAGEGRNARLLYLVATSRLLDKTMHAAIKGTSAGGKSELRKKVLEFVPPEGVISFTSLSEKTLIYADDDFAHKILSMGEAVATDEQNFQDYLLRELMSEGRIVHHTLQKNGNDLEHVVIEKEGPVSFLVTTTKNKLHPENETRMLSLEIDDTERQTRAVLGKVADVEGLGNVGAVIDLDPWRDFQRWLEAGERRVVIPYAAELAEAVPPASVRLRRDFGQVLRAIKVHALLHREHRDRDDAGRIVANIDDYAAVRDLMNSLLAETSGVAVDPEMQRTIDAVAQATAGHAPDEGATAQAVAKLLKLDKSTTWRRLGAARNSDYIQNLETRKGQPGRYRVTGHEIEPIEMLPAAVSIKSACTLRVIPLKSGKPCNPSGIPISKQRDNGCMADCNRSATECDPATARNPVATARTTAKDMNYNGKSKPVARMHGFQTPSGVHALSDDEPETFAPDAPPEDWEGLT